jgi:competence protein ComEC
VVSAGCAPALALVGGAALGATLDLDVDAVAWTLLLLSGGAALRRWRRRARPSWVAAIAAGVACVCGGALLASHARVEALHPPIRAVLDALYPGFAIDTLGPPVPSDPVPVRVRMIEDAAPTPAFTTLRARVRAVNVGGEWRTSDGGLIITIGGGYATRTGEHWTSGRLLEVQAGFRRPARFLNDGVPDFERDLALDGTALLASVKSGLLVEVREPGSVIQEAAARIRRHVRGVVRRRVAVHDPISAAIVTAVLIGDRTGLPVEVRQRLQAAGTYHVIAISGGNIAILAALCLGLLRLAGIAGRPAALVTLLGLLAYAQVVTAGASVWRATLMAVLYLAARLLDHRTPPWHALAVTAAVLVCLRPLEVLDVGFILTFGATAALLDVARRVSAWAAAGAVVGAVGGPEIADRRRRGLVRSATTWALASMAASLAVEAALLPVGAHAFSRVTSAGLALNLLAVPLMGVVQVGGMAVALLGHVDSAADWAGYITHMAARVLVDSAALVDMVPWLSVRVPPPPWPTIALYYSALAAALVGRRRLRIAAGSALVLAATAIATGYSLVPESPSAVPPVLRLTVLDVGQGDAVLLQPPGGATLLVDTGGAPFGAGGFDTGARVVVPALWARGVRSLHALLLTHGDPDHMGGAAAVVADLSPAQLWEGVPVPRHRPRQDLVAAARARRIPVVSQFSPADLMIGAARVRVLHPPQPDWERQRVRNDDSVVIEVLFGDTAILLTGDIGADVERAILPMLTPARIRILKVAHHGSRTSSSQELLEGWRPHVALISAGRGNSFGHPAADVLRRLESVGATVYRTDRHGQITVETDGSRVSVATYATTIRER